MAAMKFWQSHAVVIVVMFWGFPQIAGAFAPALLSLGQGAAATLPNCLPPNAVTTAQVSRVDGNGVLVLKSGQVVRLEGLLWPRKEDGAPDGLRSRGAALLRDLSAGKLSLRAADTRLDRYGRLRAQAISVDGKWLQREILRRGLVRVSIAPDRRECAAELYATEEKARSAHAGLWALSAYRVRDPESLRWRDLGTFQILEGRVVDAKVSGGRAYLNFGRDWRTDFTVTISPEDMKTFRRASVDPSRYTGKRVRVRGYVEHMHGFEIEIASPAAIEVLDK